MSLGQETAVDATDDATRKRLPLTGNHRHERHIPGSSSEINLAEIRVWHNSLYGDFKRPKRVTRCKHDPFAWPRDWRKPKILARPEGWTSWKDYYTRRGLLNHKDWPQGQGIEAVESEKKASSAGNGIGSGSLADQVPEKSKEDERHSAFSRLFQLTFPDGYATIPNHGKDLLCGIHALTDSLRSQLPDEHITLKNKWKIPTHSGTIAGLPREAIFDDINRAFLPERSFKPNEPCGGFVWKSKETVGLVVANMLTERSFYHLTLLTSGLKRWGRNRGLNLALGCVYADGSCRVETGEDRTEDDDTQQDAPDDAEAARARTLPEVTIWIQSDCEIQTGLPKGRRAGHYEGIRAKEPGDALGQAIGGSSAGQKRMSEYGVYVGGDSDRRPLKKHKTTPLEAGGSRTPSPDALIPLGNSDSLGLPTARKRKREGDQEVGGHGSQSVTNKRPQKASDADITPVIAQAMFNSQFMSGYRIIPNRGQGLKCGIEALTDSLKAQLPEEAVSITERGTGDDHIGYIKELDRNLLFQDIEWAMDADDTEVFDWTEDEREELRIHGLENDKEDFNVSALAAGLRRWGRKRIERDLCLGYVLANGTCVPVHYQGGADTIIWIRSTSKTGQSASDNQRFGTQTVMGTLKQPLTYDHYEGIQPYEPMDEEEAEEEEEEEEEQEEEQEDAEHSDDSLFEGDSVASSPRSGPTVEDNHENHADSGNGPQQIHMSGAPRQAQLTLPPIPGAKHGASAPAIPGLFLLQQASSQSTGSKPTTSSNLMTQIQRGEIIFNLTATTRPTGNVADVTSQTDLAHGVNIIPSWNPIDLNVPSAFKDHYTRLLHRISTRLNPLYPPLSTPVLEEAAILFPNARVLQSVADAWLKLPNIQARHRQLTTMSDKTIDAIRVEIKNNMERVQNVAEELASRLALPPPATPTTPTSAAPTDLGTHKEWLRKADSTILQERHHVLIQIVKTKTTELELRQKIRTQALTKETDGPETCLGFDTFKEAREAVMAMNGIVDRLDDLNYAALKCEVVDEAETGVQPERDDEQMSMDSIEWNSLVQSQLNVEGTEEHEAWEVEESPKRAGREEEEDGEQDGVADDSLFGDDSDKEQEEQLDEQHESESDEKAAIAAQEAKQEDEAERRKEELRKVSLNELEREVAREEGLTDELGEWS
ncbi:hypothetical protein DL546_005128 [Coniochaeta pulveracea]|uniref:Uncharacterized protein n=1 Tax=Coniochaeta pulveracea TaxID=177199 RepID=A0A420YFQ8_9PEZI|nr:hypothetical protein DL546_005128 [Coniochaeta pulveracea]